MTPEDLSAWLALATARRLAPAALRLLLSAFGDARTLIAQPFRALAETAGNPAARAIASAARADVREQFERTRNWCALPGNALVALDDPSYPNALLNMHDPPPLLYVSGGLAWLHAPSVAIVGSRNATPQGIDDAARFARELAGAGLVIVSGLALGVDAAAHRGALEAGGTTVAVVGTGADLVYPAKHRALAHEIAAHGAIVSEWPLGTPAKPAHFPQRNRLIAGMTQGVLVVEAALRSGSLITARLANEMGRDVFAIPGSIHAPLSRGCHRLIKEGAMLTETPDDVLAELGLASGPPAGVLRADTAAAAPIVAASTEHALVAKPKEAVRPAACGSPNPRRRPHTGIGEPRDAPLPPAASLPLFDAAADPPTPTQRRTQTPARSLSAPAARLLEALGHAPAALEILAARTEMDSATLQGALLELELRGHLTAQPGGRYVRHERA
nr:DNA-processing protein DprA [Trinickia acidisoli]